MKKRMKSSFFLNQEKNVIVKYVESYKPLEIYQAGIILLSNYKYEIDLNISLQW